MRKLLIKRQNRTGLRQKAKWVLYEEKHFRRLIEDVTDLVNGLVELFPVAQASQRAIEASELGTDENLLALRDIATDQDKYLEITIAKVLENHKGASYRVAFSGNNNSGFQVGNNSGQISNFRAHRLLKYIMHASNAYKNNSLTLTA